MRQRYMILTTVVGLIWLTAPRVPSAREQWQSTKTLNAGDPDRPPGSDSLRAVILISLDAETSLDLTSPAEGVDFDIDGDSHEERIAWTRPGSQLAFLCWDRDGDGTVKNGTELVGGATREGAWNGFMALRLLAPSAGGAITSEHSTFSKLFLWVDRNHDGRSQVGELRRVGEVFRKVGLGYFEPKGGPQKDEFGNVVRYQGWLLPATAPPDARSGYSPAYEVVLAVKH